VIGLTTVIWVLSGLGIYFMARGFGFQLTAAATYTILGVVVLGIMIPAGPGFLGTFQASIVLGLSLFASPEAVNARGTALANALWATQLTLQTVLGLSFLFSRTLPLGRLMRARTPPSRGSSSDPVSH
jgi:hypothetical protein